MKRPRNPATGARSELTFTQAYRAGCRRGESRKLRQHWEPHTRSAEQTMSVRKLSPHTPVGATRTSHGHLPLLKLKADFRICYVFNSILSNRFKKILRVPTTTTYPASYSRRGHARHRALPASACALRDWGLSAAPPRDAGRMLPCAAYGHAYICHSNINSCAYAYAYHWAVATATAMAIPGGRARGRGGAPTQRGVEEAGKPDHTAS